MFEMNLKLKCICPIPELFIPSTERMTTIELKYCDIPEYLRKGEFFRALSEDDPEGAIQIPTDCFAEDGEVTDLQQFTQLLRVMVFWMLDKIPLGVIKFCNINDIEVWRDVVLNLPGGDKSSLVKGLLATFHDNNGIDFNAALQLDDWDVIVRCIDMLRPDDENATIQAAQCGNLRALKLLHEKGFVWNTETSEQACRQGPLDCLQFAHENGCPWDICVYLNAVKSNHLHIIQYAHKEGLEWDASVCREAAFNGHIECLRYLLEHNCPVDESACHTAALNGHLACLQLLHQYNVVWNAVTSSQAAKSGNTVCLQYLHIHGCVWDDRTPNSAANNCAINTLRYALEQGCEYNDFVMVHAVRGSSLQCIQYLLEDQLLYMDETGFLFTVALLKGNLQCLQYLIDQGCPYQNTQFSTEEAAITMYDIIFTKNNPEFVQCLRYAVERGWRMEHNFVVYLVQNDWDNFSEYVTEYIDSVHCES